MGVDYAIMHPTPPNDALGVAGRLHMLKVRRQVESLTQMMSARGERRPPSEISIEKVILRDGRQEKVSVTLEQMAAETAPLDAAIRAAGAGARYEYGHVRYPIAESAERWLMSLLPETLECSAGVMLRSCMRDFGYDGGTVKGMRARGRMFFERAEPMRRTWRTPQGEWSLNSDQALQLLIGLGPLQPAHVLMIALMFGLLPHATAPEQLKMISKDLATRQKLLVHAPLRSPPDEARELASMMEMLRVAAAIDAVLWIDA